MANLHSGLSPITCPAPGLFPLRELTSRALHSSFPLFRTLMYMFSRHSKSPASLTDPEPSHSHLTSNSRPFDKFITIPSLSGLTLSILTNSGSRDSTIERPQSRTQLGAGPPNQATLTLDSKLRVFIEHRIALLQRRYCLFDLELIRSHSPSTSPSATPPKPGKAATASARRYSLHPSSGLLFIKYSSNIPLQRIQVNFLTGHSSVHPPLSSHELLETTRDPSEK